MLYRSTPLGHGSVQLTSATAAEVAAAYAQADEKAEIRRLSRYEYCQAVQNALWFAIRHNRHMVGELYLHDLDFQDRTTLFGIFLFAEADRGYGIGRQALTVMIDYCFSALNLELIQLGTRPDNQRAVRCYQAVGFRLVGPALERPNEIIMELWRSLPSGEQRVSSWVA